jgi:hypothetical protein
VIISSIPFDEDIHDFVPPTHQEENMMSYDPFEDLDDTLFNEFGSEKVLEETLDTVDPLEEKQRKNYALRIKSLVMMMKWRGMSIKRKKNYDKEKHIEAPLSCLPLDEGKFVQPFSPPIHDVEEATSLDDEESEGQVETTLASILPTQKEEEMVIFSHTDGIMKEPFDMVDENIDTFIQTGRHGWDFGHLIFYRDLIYENEGSPQEKGFELSSSED